MPRGTVGNATRSAIVLTVYPRGDAITCARAHRDAHRFTPLKMDAIRTASGADCIHFV
jgi:hypothetical protein